MVFLIFNSTFLFFSIGLCWSCGAAENPLVMRLNQTFTCVFIYLFIYLFVMSLFYMNSFLESGETEIHPLSQCSLVTHRDTTLPLECNKLLSFLEEVVSVLTHSFLPSFVL